jgi:hypothetical protein
MVEAYPMCALGLFSHIESLRVNATRCWSRWRQRRAAVFICQYVEQFMMVQMNSLPLADLNMLW